MINLSIDTKLQWFTNNCSICVLGIGFLSNCSYWIHIYITNTNLWDLNSARFYGPPDMTAYLLQEPSKTKNLYHIVAEVEKYSTPLQGAVDPPSGGQTNVAIVDLTDDL